MNIRLFGITVLVMLVVAGLIAGLFAGSIQRALTASPMAMPGKGAATKPAKATQTATTTTATEPLQMPTSTVAQDTFQRRDQAFWGTASDGRSWTGEANTNQAFSIVGTAGQIANGQGTLNALLGSMENTNVEVMMNGSVNHFAQGNVNLGVVLRWRDNNDWYKALIDGAHLIILKRANNKTTQLDSVPFTTQGDVIYALRFRAIGASLFARAWQNGTPEPTNWMLTVTDPTFTAGLVGVRVLVQNDTVIKITSFVATTASSQM